MRPVVADLLHGTLIAAIAAAGSCLLALAGFGRPYYVSVLLPVSMLGCLTAAWFLHLRGDRLLGSPSAMRGEEAPRGGSPRKAVPPVPGGPPDVLLAAAEARDEEPVRRTGGAPSSPRAMRALLWAAVELAAAATLLYFLWGIGASFS